jgi:Phasin protein.
MNIQFEKFVAPVQGLNALNVANIEKLVDLQLQGLVESTTAGVNALKQAASIKDLESAKSYIAGQVEAVKQIVESAVARSKSVAEIVQAYPGSVKSIVGNVFTIG